MHHCNSFLQRHQKALMIAASLYVVLLIVSHSALSAIHVWIIAAVFSILMNFTYVTEACSQGRLAWQELIVMAVLVSASLLGVIVHPLFVILAIFGHGIWDMAKHFGAGIPFFSWYTMSCFTFDITYGTLLLIYWILN